MVTLWVAVTSAVCSDRLNGEKVYKIPGLSYCDISFVNNCALASNIALLFSISSYIFCLSGLLGLNIRIIQKYTKLYRRVQQYKHANANPKKNMNKTPKPESTTEPKEPLVSPNNDLNDIIIQNSVNTKDISIRDIFSDKQKSIKSEDNESFDLTNYSEKDHDSCRNSNLKKERVPLFANVETKYMKNDTTKNEFRDGDSSKSEKISVRQKRVKNNDNVKNDEHNHGNVQNYHKNNEQELDKQVENRFGKCCLHRWTHIFKFEGFNRTTLKLSFVSIAYIVIYMPWFVIQVCMLLGVISQSDDPVLNKYLFQPIKHFPFASCAVNPVIYAFVDPTFRSQCKALFK